MGAVPGITAGLLLLSSATAHKKFYLRKVRWTGPILISYALEDKPKLRNAAVDGLAAGGGDDSHDRLTSNVRSSGRPGIPAVFCLVDYCTDRPQLGFTLLQTEHHHLQTPTITSPPKFSERFESQQTEMVNRVATGRSATAGRTVSWGRRCCRPGAGWGR